MSSFNAIRVLALPLVAAPNTIYYVKNGTKAEAYISNANGEVFPITNTAAIVELLGNVATVENYDPGDVTLMFDNALI